MVPAFAWNVAEVDPAAIVTEGAAVSSVLLLERVTVAPPEGAVPLRVTVQVLVAPDVRLTGLQPKVASATGGAVNIKLAVCDPPE